MKIKNKPLSVQIWIVFAGITLSISIILTIILPLTLRSFFTEEIYATIESAQNLMLNRYDLPSLRKFLESDNLGNPRQALESIRTVHHFFLFDNYQVFFSSPLDTKFIEQVKEQARIQQNDSQRYSGTVGDEKIFYVITKGKTLNQNVYLVSYMWDSYRQDVVQNLFKRLAIITTIVFLLSWIPAIILSKYLSRPLVSLEKKVNKLAKYEWSEPIDVDREDEIGKLGKSIEKLRNELINQKEMQQSFLQNISHELKTPVMVIRSYAQAISDGIYPKGNLDCSIKVIDEEAERLEKRIKNLLYITKLDNLNLQHVSKQNFYLDDLIKNVVERLAWNRIDIDWQLELSHISIDGDMEQWRVVIENLLDNQMRYAKNTILIALTQTDKNSILLRFFNDGPSIETEVLKTLFTRYNKGEKGQFGLGLAIVQKILELHNAKVWANNEKEGVSFYIEIPKNIP